MMIPHFGSSSENPRALLEGYASIWGAERMGIVSKKIYRLSSPSQAVPLESTRSVPGGGAG